MLAVGPHEERHGHGDLWQLSVTLLQDATHHEIPELVGTAELDVRLDCDRIHSLEQRVEELHQRDRLPPREPVGKITPLQHLGNRHLGRHVQNIVHVECAEPLGVVADLQPLRQQDPAEAVQHRLRMSAHLVGGQPPARLVLPRGVTNLCGEVTHDQDRRVAEILKTS